MTTLFSILLSSFLIKILICLFSAPDYWNSGYTFYYQIAQNFLQTGTLFLSGADSLYSADSLFATRPPLYPLFIAFVGTVTRFSPAWFVGSEALVSTLTVFCVYQITRLVTGSVKPALWAALFAAFYPYALVHETQLQEGVLYNFLSTFSVLLLLLAQDRRRCVLFFLTGIALGLASLARATHLIHSVFLTGLIYCLNWKSFKNRLLFPASLILGLCVCLAPWLIRNQHVTGSFVLTSITGGVLAEAHNPFTFSGFPYRGSIDSSSHQYRKWLEENTDLYKHIEGKGEIEQSKVFSALAWDYIKRNKAETFWRGWRKAAVNFLGVLSPLQHTVKNWIYFLSYWFLTVWAIASVRKLWGSVFLQIFLALCLSQIVLSFIFWAHTSHRSYLDPLLAVLAGIGFWQNTRSQLRVTSPNHPQNRGG
ncbi:MAG: glycosyltransferase family 39 protein [Candidatus Omnitrophica bacterium]|nr:glycosyltransferase family 39 protein [Candidatus Omnitrophota bacterium]